MKVFASIAVCFCILGLRCEPSRGQGNASKEALFEKLQSDTTGEAFERFLKLGKKDAAVREYLATHLPGKIAAGPGDHLKVWGYEVSLAGLLRIKEAIPALTQHIEQLVQRDFSTLSGQENLADYPAGRALAEIGEPSVPALFSVLETGDYQKRWVASRALNMINTPKATEALSNHLPNEPDPNLKTYIGNCIQRRQEDVPR